MTKFEMDPVYLALITRLEKEQATLDCMIKAILKYHTSCANAAKTLSADLAKCKLKLTTGTLPGQFVKK